MLSPSLQSVASVGRELDQHSRQELPRSDNRAVQLTRELNCSVQAWGMASSAEALKRERERKTAAVFERFTIAYVSGVDSLASMTLFGVWCDNEYF